MPQRARRICPRCRRPAPTTGRCPTCAARAQRSRPTWRYNDQLWQARRTAYLANNPRCYLCGRPSKTPDHWPKSRKELIAEGVPDPDADHRLRPLCDRCHRAATARLQPGGINTTRD